MRKAVKTVVLRNIITATVLILLLSACKKEVFNPELTKEFKLVSDANGATYKIKVALPDNYNSSTDKFATVYVLDGKEDFDFVANTCKEIADQKGTTNVLVVGIGYGKDRSIDYTPTKQSSVTGGGPEFLRFIVTQLIPQIERNYRADTLRSSRVILGHSYGGLFAVYSFSINNKVFGNYLILSPSLWYDNQVSFQYEKDNRAKNKSIRQLVFLGIGNKEDERRMKVPFETFYQTLHDNYANIKLEKKLETNAGHMDSKNPNIIKGLEYYFQNR